ncbi:MAG: CPBP family glutamic-type intramembrane protease, partial [Cyanobacteria bacterium J06641_5]
GRPSSVGLAVGGLGLLLYVAIHVPSGYVTDWLTGGQTNFFTTFTRIDALVCTTLLGLVCTLAYLYCGSLYPAIAEHWLVVWVWFFVCGGYYRLYPAAASSSRAESLGQR